MESGSQQTVSQNGVMHPLVVDNNNNHVLDDRRSEYLIQSLVGQNLVDMRVINEILQRFEELHRGGERKNKG